MDDKWCLRRAELVLKSVKGYVMENSVGYKTEAKMVQFLVPEVCCKNVSLHTSLDFLVLR